MDPTEPMDPTESPSIAVVGPGAIGGAVAAALRSVGHEPLLCARSAVDGAVVAIASDDGPSEVVLPATVTDPTLVDPVDVVLLAVKAHQTGGAADWLARLVGPDTIVCVLQNGVEHRERLAPHLPSTAPVVPAVVAIPAERPTADRIEVAGRATLTVPDDDAGRQIADLFDGSFVRVVRTDDWSSAAWRKLMVNAASGGICTIAGARNSLFVDDPEAADLAAATMREVAAVGRAEGAALPEDLPERILEVMAARAGGHLSSIVADRLAGRPIEWEARNEVVVRLAERHGIDVPLNRMLTALLRLTEPAG